MNSKYIAPLKISICLAFSYLAYDTQSSRFFESTVLGYEPNTVFNLIRILFPVPLTFFGSWVTVTVLMDLFIFNKKSKKQNIQTRGVINDISHSDTRINNKPLFNLTVTYNEHVRMFDNFSSDMQFKFNEGDEVIIHYDGNNMNNAYLDTNQSIELKNSNTDLKPNANFKIIEVNPIADAEINLYEIIGTVYRIDHNPAKATIKRIIPSHQTSNFMPQTIIPCIITENSSKDLDITMIIN